MNKIIIFIICTIVIITGNLFIYEGALAGNGVHLIGYCINGALVGVLSGSK